MKSVYLSVKKFCSAPKLKPVKIDFKDLVSSTNLIDKIYQAFGINGLGICIIKNVPDFLTYRRKVLTNGYKIIHEPKEVIDSISKPEFDYPIGFDNQVFITKGDKVNNMFKSFTARSLRETLVYPKNPEMEKNHTNLWPTTIPNFKEDFIFLGKLINRCQSNLLRHLCQYITYLNPTFKNKLHEDFKDESNQDSYGRLIAYSPPEDYIHEKEEDKYIWDDWHTDYNLLTGLTHPLYFTKEGKEYSCGHSSLNIKDRSGKEHLLKFEPDELAIQAEDTMFILSGGVILPTPHAVRVNPSMPLNLFRINLATFFQPNYNYVMNIPGGKEYKDIIEKDPTKLQFRNADFENGMDYATYFENSLDYLLNRKKL